MIISHKHKFIFFAVPKTATHAIREALRQHLAPDDWEQQTLFGKQYLPFPEIARMQHGHIAAVQIRPHLDPAVWEDYFKFGFVRNPFDRFVSTCFFLNRDNPGFAESAVTFMKQALSVRRFRERVLVRPQYRQLVNERGEIALNFVGRYEDLQQSYDEICNRLDLPTTELGRKNPSQHRAYTSYYDDELQQIVAAYYADDFRVFGYDLNPNPE